jgi:exopolysaccharide production protein ExoQ
MSGFSAAAACGAFVVWLLYRDAKERMEVSADAWVPLVWALIYASRPVTSWFSGVPEDGARLAAYDEGNPIEALIYVFVIASALAILRRRRVRLGSIVHQNGPLVALYLFWLMSVTWSDYPVITIKRLIKDLGNVLMVLVILSDRNPSETMKAILSRCAYVCVPLSVLFVRYFPELGRGYVGYDRSELMYVGVTTHKNSLGILALLAAVFVLWDVLDGRLRSRGVRAAVGPVVVLLMSWYLLTIADSVTSLLCAVLGTLLLIIYRAPSVRSNLGRVEVFGLGAVLLAWGLDSLWNLREAFIEGLGRDMTLTTRTEVWPVLLSYLENGLVGAGFNTFWAGRRLALLSDSVGGIIQAHNGYLETYLNGGIVGVILLGVALAAGYGRIRRAIVQGAPAIRLVVLVLGIVHNVSEASFHRLSLLWFVMLLAILEYRARPEASREVALESTEGVKVVGAYSS